MSHTEAVGIATHVDRKVWFSVLLWLWVLWCMYEPFFWFPIQGRGMICCGSEEQCLLAKTKVNVSFYLACLVVDTCSVPFNGTGTFATPRNPVVHLASLPQSQLVRTGGCPSQFLSHILLLLGSFSEWTPDVLFSMHNFLCSQLKFNLFGWEHA